MSQLSLEQYIPLFQKENIDLDSFLNLRKDQFISLGIKDPGDLWLLLNCSKQLKSHIQKRYSLCESILEEEEEENDDDEDFYSLTSNNSYPEDSPSSSSEIISRVIHTYDSFNNSRQSLVAAPPGTVIPRIHPNNYNRNAKMVRPLSMPVQLPSALSPPPDYDHHQDIFLTRRLDKSKSMIFPREEEGKEELPAYSCTVHKMGYVNIKREFDAPDIKSKWRAWRKLYVELRGTLLKIYRAAPSSTMKHKLTIVDNRRWSLKSIPLYYYYHNYYYTPIYTISLAGAEASRAFDYSRRPNVLRLTTPHGPQLLMRLSTHMDMISWIEHLQSGI